MNHIDFKSAVKNNICSGCGGCAFIAPDKIKITLDKYGQLKPKIIEELSADENNILDKVCPFSYKSLDRIQVTAEESEKYSEYIGNYIDIYAGHVKLDNYREEGSSGGFGTWLPHLLMKKNVVEHVIHVKPSSSSELLFEYNISKNQEELKAGSSSKYYPITLDGILSTIKNTDKKYLIIAIPCFVRTVRNLQNIDPVLKQRIVCIGSLYCGHLKTHHYAQYIADSIFYQRAPVEEIDFRVKEGTKKSSNYKTAVTINKNKYTKFNKEIIGTNWGLGLFKYKSCDYCEDVAGELADFSIGDAWLPAYEKDNKGTNLVIIRNKKIETFVKQAIVEGDIVLDQLTVDDAYNTQAGGYRHKRDGIHVRNKLLNIFNGRAVKTRFNKNNKTQFIRGVVYLLRVILRNYSRIYYLCRKTKFTFYVFNLGVKLLSKLIGLLNRLDK